MVPTDQQPDILSQPEPFQQALLFIEALASWQVQWDIRAEFRKTPDGGTIYKLHVRTPRKRGEEPTREREARMLCQGLINLRVYGDVRWIEHAVDPQSGEVLIDTFIVPSQWRTLDNMPAADPAAGRSEYTVVITPSGCRCNCPYAENTPTAPEPTPWGDQPSGSTAACPHSEVVEFIRKHQLCARPRE